MDKADEADQVTWQVLKPLFTKFPVMVLAFFLADLCIGAAIAYVLQLL